MNSLIQNQPPRALLTKGYLIAVVGTILWSTTAILIRYLNDSFAMPPLVLAFWRDGLVALALAAVFLTFNRTLFQLGRRNWKFLLVYGLVLAVFNALWVVSVKLNGAAVSTVLIYSSPAFTALLERFLFPEKITPVKLAAILLSILGCVLVSGAYDAEIWGLNPFGVLIGLLSGVLFSVYSMLGKESAQRGTNSWTVLFYTFSIAAAFLLLFNFLTEFPVGLDALPETYISFGKRMMWLGKSPLGWGVLILLAAGPTVGGYGLYTLSLRYLSASTANLIATLEPPLTAIQAYLFLGERFTLPQILGSALTLVGVLLIRLQAGAIRGGWRVKRDA